MALLKKSFFFNWIPPVLEENLKGQRDSLALKRIERFERTALWSVSDPIPFSVQFLITLITVELCYWHPVVPFFFCGKSEWDTVSSEKRSEGLWESLEVIICSPPPLLGHPFTIRLLEVCWCEGVEMGLVLKYEEETKWNLPSRSNTAYIRIKYHICSTLHNFSRELFVLIHSNINHK